MKKFKAILFDLDGVIVNSEEWNKDAFNEALRAFGHRELNEGEYSWTLGLDSDTQLRLIQDMRSSSLDIEAIKAEKRRLAREYIDSKCAPIDRITSMLLEVKKTWPIGVVTNCSKESCFKILDRMGIKELFGVIVTNSDVEETKPHPQPYLLACAKLNVYPPDVLVIEDSDNGVTSAEAAGCTVFKLTDFDKLTANVIKDIVCL